MTARADIETELFDVARFALPQDDYGMDIKDQFPHWRDTVIRADGLVIVTPSTTMGIRVHWCARSAVEGIRSQSRCIRRRFGGTLGWNTRYRSDGADGA